MIRFHGYNSRILSISVALFLCCFAITAKSAQTPGSPLHHFESPDHTIKIEFSSPMALCDEDTMTCQCDAEHDVVTVIACITYNGKAYKGSNFTRANLAIGIMRDAKDEVACYDLPGDKEKNEEINGVRFESSTSGDGAAGTFWTYTHYRTFHKSKCYVADLAIVTSNFGLYQPGTVKRFTPSNRAKVYGQLKKVFSSLHIMDEAVNSK